MVESAYIHIPFCKSKCKYCSFISFANTEKILGYIFSLLKDIDVNYNGEDLKTLYFGGGTPSLLSIENVKKIISKFNLAFDSEVTFELNPDDADINYLKSLRDLGINRLSMGAQSFDDNILQLIGRRHNSIDIIEAVKKAKDAGFDNISLDLIYGLPNQNFSTLQKDLETIKQLNINHISTYGLKIEEGSYFYTHLPQNLPDEDTQADMYLKINEILEQYGFERYEISNFAHKGFESKHNLNYWNNKEYYGFGVAAHGYVDGIRYSNFSTLEEYMNTPSAHECGHFITKTEKLEEEIFLGFRKSIGLNIATINENFGIDFEKKYQKILNKYIPQYIYKTSNGYALTIDGILLSNNILAEFIE